MNLLGFRVARMAPVGKVNGRNGSGYAEPGLRSSSVPVQCHKNSPADSRVQTELGYSTAMSGAYAASVTCR